MAYKTITVDNTNNVSNGLGVSILGKNGFNTTLGSILLICDSVSKVDETGNKTIKDGNLEIRIKEGFSDLLDLNFYKHILEVNETPAVFGTLKGVNNLELPIQEKDTTGSPIGHVGYNPIYTQISMPIESFDINNRKLKVNNSISGNGSDTFLLDKLPSVPFYVRLYQILDQNFFANNSVYVEGSRSTFTKTFNTTNVLVNGYCNVNINVSPKFKQAISVYLDNEEQQQSIFTWDNQANVNVFVGASGTGKLLTIRTDYYTVPALEPGDNISLFSSNVYAISETSYNPTSPSYNVRLTANSIYRVKFGSALTANVSGTVGVNISPDIQGTVGNLNSSANTFTVDYDESQYPNLYELGSYKIYKVSLSKSFETLDLTKDNRLENVPIGNYVVRARNTNSFDRKSPYVTKNVEIQSLPIGRVGDITIEETLYRDTNVGVAVRAIVSFVPLENQSVTEYEISYKLVEQDTNIDLISYSTVKVPASGIAADGKIYARIDNIERGIAPATYKFYIRVTPLNNDLRGITREASKDIIGKSAKPAGVTRFSAAQLGTQLSFSWTVPRDTNGDPLEIDLYQFTIKQLPGTYTSVDETTWQSATEVGSEFANTSSHTAPIKEYGTYTYFIRTKDTTGNQCEDSDIALYTLTTIRPFDIVTFRAYSEDNPSANDFTSTNTTNNNYFEYYYPSFANSSQGGIAGAGRHRVDNSNGTSIGFSVASGLTDLIAAANATYFTQIRDLGQLVTGRLMSTVNLIQTISTSYNDFKEDLYTGVSEASVSSNTFKDTGVIGLILSSNNAVYDSNNKTLTSGGITGNVYAIWNYGQFVGDVANGNSYALIAGVINNDLIALGETYFANGIATGGNTLSNLTGGISYTLVNLNQFSDKSSVTYSGPSGAIGYNVDVRYSTSSNTYYTGNNQVNTYAFTGYAVNDGWTPLVETDLTFRHFQLRTSITNTRPDQVSTILDQLRYAVNLGKKSVSFTNTISSNNTEIGYDSAGFSVIPSITVTPQATLTPTIAIVNSKTINKCYVSLYNSTTGVSVTGVTVDIKADGA